jgi:hypothetical protein
LRAVAVRAGLDLDVAGIWFAANELADSLLLCVKPEAGAALLIGADSEVCNVGGHLTLLFPGGVMPS